METLTQDRADLVRTVMLMRDCSVLAAMAWLQQPHTVQVRIDGLAAWLPIDWADFYRFVGGYEGQDLSGPTMDAYLHARGLPDAQTIDVRLL